MILNRKRCFVELPEELWILIFITCPVKSLLVGMCVCKHWYIMIKDPSFVRRHLQFQKMASKSSGDFLLQHIDANEYNLFLVGEDFINSDTSLSLSPVRNLLPFSLGDEKCGDEFDGPINGLYCLHNKEGCVLIWNPATNEIAYLPSANDHIPYRICLETGIVGFGIDPLDEEDYKVVLFATCDILPFHDELYCMLYTTKTNTWRRIKDRQVLIGNPSRRPLNSTYLNGFYYWMGYYDFTAIVWVFDMSYKEVFRRMAAPSDGNLALHNEHINLFCVHDNMVDIWVLLEDDNWLKKISIKDMDIQGSVVSALGFWKTENEIFIVVNDSKEKSRTNSQIILYNTTTRKMMSFEPRGRIDGFKVSSYYESLVSINNGIAKFRGADEDSLFESIYDFFTIDYEWIWQ